ncbi:voltage-dependent anion-selective channel protein 2-like [Watersipora subatra]|uniref:voltage-dependent anion-selective channel protein 2-like n=1 Tax=Watersipora subatra TaxID=2589382 RepID=UPI00355ACF09
MAPPCYADLGKKALDLHTKDFHPGLVKFQAKTKSVDGLKFSTGGQRDMESGKMLAGSEVTFNWPDYGLKYVEKWNTANDLVVDMSLEDKLLEGAKVSFVSSINPTTKKKKGTVKTSYKSEYFNGNVDVDLDYGGPVIKSSLVGGYNGWFAGYQMSLNASKKALTDNNFALSYDGGDHILHAAAKNGVDFRGSYFHKYSPEIELGLAGEFSSATKRTQGGAILKYIASEDTSMKVKVGIVGLLGLSVQQKLTQSTNLTLSALIDAKNITAGGHRVGMSLEFEQ